MLSPQLADEARAGAYLSTRLQEFVRQVTPEDLNQARYRAAFDAIDKALAETLAYVRERGNNNRQDTRREEKLSDLWRAASPIVAEINAELANACLMKGYGWTNPDVWEQATAQGIKIEIVDMQDALAELNRKRQEAVREQERQEAIRQQEARQENIRASAPSWFPVAGAAFSAVTVLFLMAYLIIGPQFSAEKKIVFDVLMAFCASASAAFLGGDAAAKGKVPFFQNSPIQFSAIGGIGTLIVVYLVLHYSG